MPGKVHADDTLVKVLEPGNGKTRTGRLWAYVRDDRNAASETPPAVWFSYSVDRKSEHPSGTWRRTVASFRQMRTVDTMRCTKAVVSPRRPAWRMRDGKFTMSMLGARQS